MKKALLTRIFLTCTMALCIQPLWGMETNPDEGIKPLTNLTGLNLNYNDTITDEGIKPLTNLTGLNLVYNDSITDEGIKPLTNLTNLNLNYLDYDDTIPEN